MSAEQIIVIDVAPKGHVILHKGDEAWPHGRLTIRNIVILRERPLDDVVEALLAELGAQLSGEVVILLRTPGFDLEPGAELIPVLGADKVANLGEELENQRHLWFVERCG
jgi:hypothetical protein